MGPQDGGVGNSPARQHHALPVTSLRLFQFHQSRGETVRIAGQQHRVEIRVIFAGTRQRQLQQAADRRSEYEQQDGKPRHLRRATEQNRRKIDEQRKYAERRKDRGEPAYHVGDCHDADILGADMRDFMRNHARKFAQREGAYEPVRQADRRIMLATHREGIHQLRRQHVEFRLCVQAGALGKLVQ